MIEKTTFSSQNPAALPQNSGKKILHMVKNDRMGGFVPAWKTVENDTSALSKVENNLSNIGKNTDNNPSQTLSIMPLNSEESTPQNTSSQNQDEFTFGDFIDMINPLHHIPVVNNLYRHFTGDTIKPIGKIIGGGLFGGVIGASAGLVNTIVTHETGTDITGNALSVASGKNISFKSLNPAKNLEKISSFNPSVSSQPATKDTTKTPLPSTEDILHAPAGLSAQNPYINLPANLLAFTDLGTARYNN